MRNHRPLRGLYAITPEDADTRRLLQRVGKVLDQGIALLQYRNKRGDASLRMEQALALKLTCLPYDVPLIVNDDIALARQVQADGVHLGVGDGAVATAREELGEHALIGVTCHASIERAQVAKKAGADYLAFGAFHPSPSKPDAPVADPAILREAKALGLPLAAIGGIKPAHVAALRQSGADMVAVISGLWAGPDPAAAARAYIDAFGHED
ncbi:MAG: thiamine phosphate synthase [Proteobacteria bacterium]|nr:thiamine phosphate synthase [Pseudomonadota bacterium]